MIALAAACAVALIVQAVVIVQVLRAHAVERTQWATERHLLTNRVQAPALIPMLPEVAAAQPRATDDEPEPDEYDRVGVVGGDPS